MDAMKAEEQTSAGEEAALARTSLAAIAVQCEHALTERLAKRYSTRDSLKALEKRCKGLLDLPDEDRAWREEFEKVVTTANAVFDQVIAEVEPAGHA